VLPTYLGTNFAYGESMDIITTITNGTYLKASVAAGVTNWQTVPASDITNDGSVYTTNQSWTFTSQTTTNFSFTGMQWNVPEIIRGRLYVSTTNTIPFSKTATLTFRDRSVATSGSAVWQSDMLMSAVLTTNAISVGATNVLVQDATDFAANSLVYLTGTTNEFVRVLAVSGNNLIFKFACTNSHDISNLCSRVREFGGFKTFDSSGTKTLWGGVDFTSATTGSLNIDLEYAK